MGIDFYQNTLIFKEIIDRADAVLDFDLPEFWLTVILRPIRITYSRP
ncbi:acyl-carrier-protein S-malonyltransferase [Lactobacillus casei subsp. casei ATCC 393] [Lacticaseibacillus rhamnosus]|nr:acyl-carrier-protein S-malonyltransferase [Lactobacillus casei subsp. casei ATCC 393] [Lacticaseibacillus rhamnosus]